MSCPNKLRSGVSAALLAALLLVPSAGYGRETWKFVPSTSLSQSYESNPLGRSEDLDQIDDFVTRLQTALALSRATETGNAQLLLKSRARFYQDLNDLNTLDPSVKFKLSQKLTPHLELLGDASWSQSKSTEPIDLDGFNIHSGRPDVTSWDAGGGIRYSISPLSGMRLTYKDSSTDYEQTEVSGRQRDRGTSALTLLFDRKLSPTEQFQASFSYQLTDFVETDPQVGIVGREAQDDTQIAGTLAYTRQFSPRTSLNLTGGVRSLHSEGSGFTNALVRAPGGAPTNLALDERSTAFTGGVSLIRRWKHSSLTLGFNQQTRPASGRSSSIDVQTYSADYSIQLAKRVSMRLSAALSDQSSASDNFGLVDATAIGSGFFCPPGSLFGGRNDPDGVTRPVCAVRVKSAIDQQVRHFGLDLDWRVARRFTTFFSYDYMDQEAPGLVGQDFDNHRVQVGLRYSFDIDVP